MRNEFRLLILCRQSTSKKYGLFITDKRLIHNLVIYLCITKIKQLEYATSAFIEN